MIKELLSVFHELFGEPEIVVRSPGRVNIIGEHTDYNEGFVLPAAIDKAIYVAVNKRDDNCVSLYAENFDEKFECNLDELRPLKEQWPNYILGVADQLQKNGYTIRGFNLVMDGDVPIGAGLSSSAAVECAVVFALNEIFSLRLDKMEMIKMAQKAEHTFAGVMCGVMDQFASMFGKEDQVIRLDCRSLDYEYVPLNMKGYKIVLLNTNVKHSLASSQYNVRKQQCEQGVQLIKQKEPAVKSLRDVTVKMLNENVLSKDKLVYRRCKYVVEENERLLTGCQDLKNGSLAALGRKMFETHKGLSEDYEVSCKELDFLVEYVKSEPGVLGARMVGGGFGGCTINLVKEENIDPLTAKLSEEYMRHMNLPLTVYVAQIENGTSVLSTGAIVNFR